MVIDTVKTWHFDRYELSDMMQTCDACGHDIKHIYRIADSEGRKMKVGSECVNSYCGSGDMTAKRIQKRATKAAAEWRNGWARVGETREAFITRRVNELGHAYAACREWTADWDSQQRQMRGLSLEARQIHEDAWLSSLEQKYGANRRDFRTAIWAAKKL